MAKSKKVSKVRRWRASTDCGDATRDGIIRVSRPGKRGNRLCKLEEKKTWTQESVDISSISRRKKLHIKGFHPFKEVGRSHRQEWEKHAPSCVDFYKTAASIYNTKKSALSQKS